MKGVPQGRLCPQQWPCRGLSGLSWLLFAAPSPDFVTITFLRPLFLQVTSDFPQVLNFVLQGFDLRQRAGEEALNPGVGAGAEGTAWGCPRPLPAFVAAEGSWVPPAQVARLPRTSRAPRGLVSPRLAARTNSGRSGL